MSYTPDAPPVESKEPDAQPSAVPKAEKRKKHRYRHRSTWYRRLGKRLNIQLRLTRVLFIALALVAVVVVITLALVIDSTNRVQMSMTSFQRVVNSLSNVTGTDLTLTDFNRLSTSVSDLNHSLASARSRLSFLQPIASFNTTFNTTLTALEAAEEVTSAAGDILDGLQPTLFFLVSGSDTQAVVTQISSGARMVELLRIGRGRFVSADEHLDTAGQRIERIDLSGANSSLILQVQELVKYRQLLADINDVLLNAPDVLNSALGISSQRNYLVLSQNNDELRPSGGYLGTYGWITIRNGRVTDYAYSPTTATSPNPPPASFASQLNIPTWWLQYREPIYAAWDGSWFADFPSTARMAMWYYNSGSNPQSPVDGAIALDITGFEQILGVIGTVLVPGYNTPVTTANFREVVYNIRDFGGGEVPHKRFLAALYQEIFSQWQAMSADPTKNTELLGVMLQGMQEKHIMMYFSDEHLNRAINLLGWGGAQKPATENDYLMVADSNLGNKSNHSIIRSLTYDVDIQPEGSIRGRMTLDYDYSATVTANDPAFNPEFNGLADYNNLVQIFVPTGTTLTEENNLTNAPTVVNNSANTEFVTQLYIPHDSTQRFQFSYLTKPLIETLGSYKRYSLLVQKQPGTPSNALNVQVMLPENATLISTSPEASASYNLDRPIVEFRTDLTVDRWIEIIYQD